MFSVRRARADISESSVSVPAGCSLRLGIFRDFCGRRRNIEDYPMIVHFVFADKFWNIGIIHNQNQGFGILRNSANVQFRVDVFAFACVFRWDFTSFMKGRAG
jgi:hypothetical protein